MTNSDYKDSLYRPNKERITNEEIDDLANKLLDCSREGIYTFVRVALTRWGCQYPQPVPVSERLPGMEDCTAQGWCWVFYRGFVTWTLEPPLGQDGKHTGYTHWLPASALPTPEAPNV